MARRRTVLVTALIAAALALAGCGSSPAAGGPVSAPATPMNDPNLLHAADTVQPVLEKSFADYYAGLALDHSRHVMIVYRRPDPALDAAVKSRAGGVAVDFRDAKYSLAEMQAVVRRVMADRAYWARHGVSVQTAAPMVDGSSVRVGTTQGAPAEAALFGKRYGAGAVTVEKAAPTLD